MSALLQSVGVHPCCKTPFDGSCISNHAAFFHASDHVNVVNNSDATLLWCMLTCSLSVVATFSTILCKPCAVISPKPCMHFWLLCLCCCSFDVFDNDLTDTRIGQSAWTAYLNTSFI